MTKEDLLKELAEETFITLRPSTVHGIGVFALRDIPKGCKTIFSRNVGNWIKVPIRDIENLPALSDSILAFLEFFLLGISSIYIAQNLTMVGAYLPGKRYMESVREMNEVHLERFSEEQVYAVDSIIISIISLTGFVLNYYFQWVPVNFMIWAMITLAPVLLFGVHRIFS